MVKREVLSERICNLFLEAAELDTQEKIVAHRMYASDYWIVIGGKGCQFNSGKRKPRKSIVVEDLKTAEKLLFMARHGGIRKITGKQKKGSCKYARV